MSGMIVGIFSPAAEAETDGYTTDVKWNYYSITGKTSRELKDAMKRKGPKGYWAYAKWYIRWTGDCKVSLSLDYTMPSWENRKQGSDKLQMSWDRMIAKLKAHEEFHGSHGIKAAREIVQANCKGAHQIIAKWAKEDKFFDIVTAHGRKQGVVLP